MRGRVSRSPHHFYDRCAWGYATTYGYDALGRQTSVTDPLTNTVTTAYDAEGRVLSQRGATYPVDYAYDEFGEKVSMTTYRDINAAGDMTRWLRDEATGLVTNKVYADGVGPTYAYTPDGRLETRIWARGDECEMLYDENRRLQEVSYSSADTPCVAFERDRSGMAMSGSMSNGDNASYLRDEWHCTTNEILHIGDIPFAIERRYDEFGRDKKVDVWFNGTRYSSKVRIYDDSGRIFAYAMTNSAGRGITAGYSYDADSRVSSLRYVLPGRSELRLDLDRNPLRPGLVTNRVYTCEQEEIYRYSVAYDALGRPIGATDLFQIGREWLYNSRSELVSALVGTNSYSYGYDTIGNRIRSNENTVTNFYAANGLNQYASIGSGTNFVYDADGNMTSDGTFSYSYDAENRLLAAYPLSPAVGSLAVENRYDHRHRRSRKIVKQYDGADWETKETHTFVWDGNNIVLERVEFANGVSRTFEYFWGADKSGSEQGAGGVEGLLAVSMDGVFYVPCYDHNGNIVLYVSETGSIAAQYVYDPYGNVVETYGNLAEAFSFGFSTKYHDRETGMVGYQRRFYRPDLGRWLNRDPIEEEGGQNLYAFCLNNPEVYIDAFGQVHWKTVLDGALQVASGIFMMITATTTEVGSYGMSTPLSYALGAWASFSIVNGITTLHAGFTERGNPDPYQIQIVEYVYEATFDEPMSDGMKTAVSEAYYGIDLACSCYTISVTWKTMVSKRIIRQKFAEVPVSLPNGVQVIKVESSLSFVGYISGAGTQATSAAIDYYSIFSAVYNLSDEYFNGDAANDDLGGPRQ